MIIAERTRGLGTVIALLVCPSLAPASDPATQVAPAHSQAGVLSALLSQPSGACHQAVAWIRSLGRSRLAASPGTSAVTRQWASDHSDQQGRWPLAHAAPKSHARG